MARGSAAAGLAAGSAPRAPGAIFEVPGRRRHGGCDTPERPPTRRSGRARKGAALFEPLLPLCACAGLLVLLGRRRGRAARPEDLRFLEGELRELHYLHGRWIGRTGVPPDVVRHYRVTVYLELEGGSIPSRPTAPLPAALHEKLRGVDVQGAAFGRTFRLHPRGAGVFEGTVGIPESSWRGEGPPVRFVAYQPGTGRLLTREAAGPHPDPYRPAARVVDTYPREALASPHTA